MHILHLATEKTWRGGENQLGYLLRESQSLAVTHTVALPAQAESKAKYQPYASLLELPFRPIFHPSLLASLLHFLRHSGCDIIHAHTSKGHSLGLLLKYCGAPQPLIVHRRVETKISRSPWSQAKYLSPKIAHYIAISKKIAEDLVLGGVADKRISIIPSAVDPKPYGDLDRKTSRKKLLQELDLPQNNHLVMTVSHLSPLKGIDTFIRAFSNISSQHPDWHAVIVGAGEEKEHLVELVSYLKQEQRITFLGFRSDVPELLSAADILCLPSTWEGLGTILLDAILAGCTVIGSSVGGIPEIIKDGETGLLFPAQDQNRLATSIARAMADPSLRQQLNSQARDHVQQTFSLHAMVEKTIELYKNLSRP